MAAANPILQKMMESNGGGLGGLSQAVQMIAGMANGMKGKNPMPMLRLIAAQNPTVKSALDLIQKNNGDAEGAFRALAQENGIDPEQILSALRGAGIK